MKKNILTIIFLFLLIVSYSCNDKDETITGSNEIEMLEDLINDSSFITMMNNVSSINSEKNLNININLALELTSRDHLNDQEIVELSNALGFIDPDEMISSFTDQINLSLDIEERYRISTYDIEYIHSVLLSENFAKSCIDGCSTRSTNCVVAATATAVVAHLGCATLDITIIAGIICHGAVTANQYVDNSNCRHDLENCIKNCQ